MARNAIGIRALKNDLSRWIARVRGGQELLVTDRGRPVARLVPVDQVGGLDALVAAGLVQPAPERRRDARIRPRVRLRGKGPTLSDYVLRGRR